MYRKNTASQFVTFCMISSTDGSPVTGITPTCRRCIDGTFAAGGGTVTEDTGLGFYKYAMAQADTNGNNIGLRFTGTGAIDVAINFVTTAADPTDTVRFGLTALPNAAADAAGGLPISDAGGLDLDGLNTNVSAILTDTGSTGVLLAATATSAQLVDDVWDEATAGHVTAGSTAVALTDVLADTGTSGVLLAATATSAQLVDDVWDEAKSGHTTQGTYGESFNSIVSTAVNDASASTTSFITDLTEATDSHYVGRIVIFTTGALKDQATDITAYTGATKTLTVTALTEAPANNDEFIIV